MKFNSFRALAVQGEYIRIFGQPGRLSLIPVQSSVTPILNFQNREGEKRYRLGLNVIFKGLVFEVSNQVPY